MRAELRSSDAFVAETTIRLAPAPDLIRWGERLFRFVGLERAAGAPESIAVYAEVEPTIVPRCP